jgi:hypothetical protein
MDVFFQIVHITLFLNYKYLLCMFIIILVKFQVPCKISSQVVYLDHIINYFFLNRTYMQNHQFLVLHFHYHILKICFIISNLYVLFDFHINTYILLKFI